MIKHGLDVKIQKSFEHNGYGVYLFNYNYPNKELYHKGKFELISDFGHMCPYSFIFPDEVMQDLMNQMWENGIRPSKFNTKDESAQAAHLEDMRTIAFKFIEKSC